MQGDFLYHLIESNVNNTFIMPVTKQSFRRMSILYRRLEYYFDRGLFVPTRQLVEEVNERTDNPVCKSSIEKDLFALKIDFDIELETGCNNGQRGIKLATKIDFKKAVLEYLGVND